MIAVGVIFVQLEQAFDDILSKFNKKWEKELEEGQEVKGYKDQVLQTAQRKNNIMMFGVE
jgi:hypothetical protein